MTSISFDPMSQVYDAIRGYPQEVSRKIAQEIDLAAHGNAQTRFLEVGVGTGRIGFPMGELERDYTAIDISENMLNQFEQKLCATGWRETPQPWGSLPDEETNPKPNVRRFSRENKQGMMRLVQADMTALPFRDASFDAVIAVHVFNFVSAWQQALQEILRVLRPGGTLIRCWNANWHERWVPGTGDIRNEWSKIVQELGGSVRFPGTTEQPVTAWLQAHGLETEQREMLRWERPVTPRLIFESLSQYQWTGTWSVPDDLFAASMQRLRQWIDEHYGGKIDERFTEEEHLMIGRTSLS